MTIRELRTDFEKQLNKRGVYSEVGLTETEDGAPLIYAECDDTTRRKVLQVADSLGLYLYYDAETSLYFKVPKYYMDTLEETDNAGLFYDGFM